jgi:large subunit ribosomal protein L19
MKNKYLALVDQHALGVAGNLTAKQAEAMKAPMKREIEPFEIGDTVDVHHWIELGEKGRTQIFSGTVIAKRGSGPQDMFTVRRIVQGEGVERVFPLNSPKIVKIEVKRRGRARRAKLYYLRDRVGKATRVQERKKSTEKPAAAAPAAPASTAP